MGFSVCIHKYLYRSCPTLRCASASEPGEPFGIFKAACIVLYTGRPRILRGDISYKAHQEVSSPWSLEHFSGLLEYLEYASGPSLDVSIYVHHESDENMALGFVFWIVLTLLHAVLSPGTCHSRSQSRCYLPCRGPVDGYQFLA